MVCKISEQSESRNQCYMALRAERVDVHACKTQLCGLREASFWPRNGLRSNFIASKLQKFSVGRGMPPAITDDYNLTTPNLMANFRLGQQFDTKTTKGNKPCLETNSPCQV